MSKGKVTALKQQQGEKYAPFADNDFILSYRFTDNGIRANLMKERAN
ncbi:MAG: hypothetical protein AABZ32_03525 [Bacteroidota bacterium]